MPRVFEYNGYKFFFFSNEGIPVEPIHIYVRKGGAQAKIWIEPKPELAENYGFSARELRVILGKVEE
ncbi:MAG: DUF4160 domain-containing protein [Spirochaetales bacterium]|nr:DUF4160 domain-containing protein [Spirochaetales bacterium]